MPLKRLNIVYCNTRKGTQCLVHCNTRKRTCQRCFSESGSNCALYVASRHPIAQFAEREGEMLEWFKRHAWKACKLQKGFRGSNPRLSAKIFSLSDYQARLRNRSRKKALNKVPAAACGDYEAIPVEKKIKI